VPTNTYDIGDLVTVECTFLVEAVPDDPLSAVPADPATVTLRTRSPGGTITSYTYVIHPIILRDAEGTYHADLSPIESGTWYYRWEGTGPAQSAEERRFRVRQSKIVAG